MNDADPNYSSPGHQRFWPKIVEGLAAPSPEVPRHSRGSLRKIQFHFGVDKEIQLTPAGWACSKSSRRRAHSGLARMRVPYHGTSRRHLVARLRERNRKLLLG